jgi:hypothetical protein
MAKDNTAPGFVLSQEADSLTIREDQIREVQDGHAADRLGLDQPAQFIHIVCVKVTADREHNWSAARAMNSEHRRPIAPNAIATPLGRSLNLRASDGRSEARFRQW